MVMKKDRRKRDIKTKLLAAVCMLMISCIMVVSSTYAWFTLSTAPEVSGITTSIGANGNLEMALLPAGYTTLSEALAAIGASGSEKNSTWGNLVDMTWGTYGMDQIVLNPATTTISDGKLPDNFVFAPTYGADGRYSGLNASAMDKIFSNGAFATDGFGLRAVGTSSGMSAHEMAYRTALSNADTAFDNALSAAKSAITNGGTVLADMAIKKTQNSAATYDQNDIADLIAAYGYISNAVDKIKEAMRLYIIADYLATTAVNEDTFSAFQKTAAELTLEELITTYSSGFTAETMIAAKNALDALKNTISENVEALEGMTAASYAWSAISPYVTPLADVDNMELNGHPIADYFDSTKTDADISNLVNGERKLVVNKDGKDTSGLFVGLANFVDSFSTPVTFEELSYGTLTVPNVSVTMVINKTTDSAYLKWMDSVATAYESGVFSSAAQNIDSFYGFIIDMAFRTNAAGSDLKLQTDAMDRIYADNTANPDTMGGGSYMSYTASTDSGYTKEQLISLMEHIRIVLFNPADNTIYGYARLNSAKATYSAVEGDEDADEAGSITVTMPIEMCDADGNWKTKTGEDGMTQVADSTIMSLVQNEATAVSTLVYLEGTDLENSDVANGNITGEMNIQFASSAELVPMEYNDLRTPSSTSSTTTTTPTVDYTITPTVTDGTDAVADAVSTVAVSGTTAGFTLSNTNYTVASVTVDGTEVSVSNTDGYYYWTISDAMTSTSTVVITLTAVSSGG